LVEYLVWDQGVAGSNPVFPIGQYLNWGNCLFFIFIFDFDHYNL